MFTVKFTDEAEAVQALRALESGIAAMHNHIASAIENPAHWGEGKPAEMVRELRVKQSAAKNIRSAFYDLHGHAYTIGA